MHVFAQVAFRRGKAFLLGKFGMDQALRGHVAGDFKWERARVKSLHGKVYNGGKGAQRVPQRHGGVHGAPSRSPKVVSSGWDDFSRCKSIF